MQGRVSALKGALALALGAALLSAAPAGAATLTVTGKTDSSDACAGTVCPSIRSALAEAAKSAEHDTIVVGEGDFAVMASPLAVSSEVTIQGASARATRIHGGASYRVFDVSPGVTATISHVTMRDGDAGAGDGGVLLNAGALVLDRVRVTAGKAAGGGGIASSGSLTLDHSLVDGNEATGTGGGILSSGTLTLRDTTIASNRAQDTGGVLGMAGTLDRVTVARNAATSGGGVSGALRLHGSLLAGNLPADCGTGLASDGGNFASTACTLGASTDGFGDPKLGTALVNAGGETDVLRLAPDSVADGHAGPCAGTDQRELARPQGGGCEPGAYEIEAVRLSGPSGLTNARRAEYAFAAAPGSTFRCRLDGSAPEPCASPQPFDFADGAHTFSVQAMAAQEPISDPVERTLTVDTVAPPAPVISGGPDGFELSAEAGAALACRLDRPAGLGAFAACASGVGYPGLDPGDYRLVVQAMDAAGNTSAAAEHPFSVVAVVPAPTPSPFPAAVPTATPSFHQTVVLRPATGRTLVRRPGASAFEELRSKTAVPLGTTVDVKSGVVVLTAAPAAGARPESAKLYGGEFTVTQPAGATELALSETLRCGRTRKLWSDGAGTFRVRGRYGSATGRGAKWLVQDSCSSTTIRVSRGVVAARDDRTRKTLLVRAGRHYTAQPNR